MTRIEYINSLGETKRLSDSEFSVVSSLIYALTPQEACNYFDFTFQQNYRLRRYVLKKIGVDVSKKYLPLHEKFLKSLIEKLDENKFKRKESCASSLDFLYYFLPNEKKNLLIKKLLDSSSIRNRERAYKKIRREWNKKHLKSIQENWTKYHDHLCLRIILEHFSIDYLIKNYKELMLHCEAYEQSKLFLRIGMKKPSLLKELRDSDEISYAYVMAKFNKKISKDEASRFIESNYRDERVGLLLWSFGQMGLWDNIVEYNNDYREKRDREAINNLVHRPKNI